MDSIVLLLVASFFHGINQVIIQRSQERSIFPAWFFWAMFEHPNLKVEKVSVGIALLLIFAAGYKAPVFGGWALVIGWFVYYQIFNFWFHWALIRAPYREFPFLIELRRIWQGWK